jgi:L-asparaginase/Glu-tRNA(Gln) amidotransferase subunit D
VARRHRLMRHGMIAGEDFSPQKARILLSLCLASGFGIEDIRNSFAGI